MNGLRITAGAVAVFGWLVAGSALAGTGIISGAINANGTQQLPSSKYSVAHSGTGHYLITFTKPYSVDPICVYAATGFAISTALSENSSTCGVMFINSTSGVATDTIFNFVAVPISN